MYDDELDQEDLLESEEYCIGYQRGKADAYNEVVYDKMNDTDIDEFIEWITDKALDLIKESEET